MTTCTESGTQKMGISMKWVFMSAISTAKLTTPDLKFSPIWKRLSTVYPGRFILSCCCHLLLNFILCLSSQIRNPLALFRLICHIVVGLMFFPVLLTVSDFSLTTSICVSNFLFHLLHASPLHLYLLFCSLIQSPHLWSQSQGWKLMAPPRRHWARVIILSHGWLCATFSITTLRLKCWYFPLNFRCCFSFFDST